VDFPSLFSNITHGHTVKWASTDNAYWNSFLSSDGFSGTPENPLAPSDDPVFVDPQHLSKTSNVEPKAGYCI
jgi:hypothetical protein